MQAFCTELHVAIDSREDDACDALNASHTARTNLARERACVHARARFSYCFYRPRPLTLNHRSDIDLSRFRGSIRGAK